VFASAHRLIHALSTSAPPRDREDEARKARERSRERFGSRASCRLARLQEEFPDIQLTMVGPDKGDGSLQETRALAEDLGVAHRLEFVGRVPKSDIAKWINSGDIFLNTSSVDNCPVTVLEAMACGACVVTTKVGGIPYVCSHGSDAMLSAPGDTEAMVASVAQILHQPELAGMLSRNARSRVELLDWAAILPRWTSLLRRVANRGNVLEGTL